MTILYLKGCAILSQSCACEVALTVDPIYILMISDYLVKDFHLHLLAGALPKRISFLKYPTFLLVTCAKYSRMRLSHKTLGMIGSCILLMIELLVCHAAQGFLSTFCHTHISKTLILLLSPAFNVHVSEAYRKTKKTSNCIHLFFVFLKILLLHLTLRHLMIADLLKEIWRHISTNKPPSASIVEPKYTKALTFPDSLRAAENGRLHAFIRSPSFLLAIFTRLRSFAISTSSKAIKVLSSSD